MYTTRCKIVREIQNLKPGSSLVVKDTFENGPFSKCFSNLFNNDEKDQTWVQREAIAGGWRVTRYCLPTEKEIVNELECLPHAVGSIVFDFIDARPRCPDCHKVSLQGTCTTCKQVMHDCKADVPGYETCFACERKKKFGEGCKHFMNPDFDISLADEIRQECDYCVRDIFFCETCSKPELCSDCEEHTEECVECGAREYICDLGIDECNSCGSDLWHCQTCYQVDECLYCEAKKCNSCGADEESSDLVDGYCYDCYEGRTKSLKRRRVYI
jgi:hypothetical protein